MSSKVIAQLTPYLISPLPASGPGRDVEARRQFADARVFDRREIHRHRVPRVGVADLPIK
jgi:hypothetical protein